jgi:AmmeMemoRadiSam system protein A
MLTPKEQRALLELAVKSLLAHLQHRPLPPPPELTEPLRALRAVFVTWRKQGELRGCMGTLVATDPLWRAVQSRAITSATSDPRFLPIATEEIPDLSLDISALTPLQPVRNTEEIEVGKHGLWIRKGSHSGVLLPQVATEHGWTRDEFLRMTCRKAGLRPDEWTSGAEICTFSAEVFGGEALELLHPGTPGPNN